MTTPRKDLVDSEQPLYYHLVSECVRNSYLCGYDRRTGKDYSHRKQWFIDHMRELAPSFALNIEAYVIMSNHFHLIVYYDPKACTRWSDEEVAERWTKACPVKKKGKVDKVATAIKYECLLRDPVELNRVRYELGNLSTFMKLLKQPISTKANAEDGCGGHFFAKRFWSCAILDEEGLLASMAYVDLNPVRAKIADSIETSLNTSIRERITALPLTQERLAEVMGPLMQGLEEDSGVQRPTLGAYITRLRVLTAHTRNTRHPKRSEEQLWIQQNAVLKKRQRAVGAASTLERWLNQRGMRRLETPLPV